MKPTGGSRDVKPILLCLFLVFARDRIADRIADSPLPHRGKKFEFPPPASRLLCFQNNYLFCVVVIGCRAISQDSVGLSPYKNIVYISLTFVSFIFLLFAANTCSEHARTAAYFIIESIY